MLCSIPFFFFTLLCLFFCWSSKWVQWLLVRYGIYNWLNSKSQAIIPCDGLFQADDLISTGHSHCLLSILFQRNWSFWGCKLSGCLQRWKCSFHYDYQLVPVSWWSLFCVFQLQKRAEQMKKNLEQQEKELQERRVAFELEKQTWEDQQKMFEVDPSK